MKLAISYWCCTPGRTQEWRGCVFSPYTSELREEEGLNLTCPAPCCFQNAFILPFQIHRVFEVYANKFYQLYPPFEFHLPTSSHSPFIQDDLSPCSLSSPPHLLWGSSCWLSICLDIYLIPWRLNSLASLPLFFFNLSHLPTPTVLPLTFLIFKNSNAARISLSISRIYLAPPTHLTCLF